MKPLSSVAEALPKSGIREVKALADQMENVIHLEVGEPSFNTPAHIIDAAFEAAGRGETKYTSNYGTPKLRNAIAAKYSAAWDADITIDNVLASSGGVNAIATTCGDRRARRRDPGARSRLAELHQHRGHRARRAGALSLPAGERLHPDPDEIEALITPRTKIMILCNPSNPTGVVFPAETVEALVTLAQKHDLYLIADEIYEALVFDGEHTPASRFDNDGRVITISGFSKTYAMTGWRLGYAIANPELILLAGKMMEPLVSCPTGPRKRPALRHLLGPQDCVSGMREAYHHRRDVARDLLAPAGMLPVVPQGAFYALLDLRVTGHSEPPACAAHCWKRNSRTRSGDTFGDVASHGMVRLSLASSDEDVEEGCRRILRFAERHAAMPAR